MNIAIDVGHPAHVHLFKHFAWDMQKRGHQILFTVRDKEHAAYLAEKYQFRQTMLGKHFKGKFGKIWGLVKFNWQLFKISLKFKPDIFISHGSIYAAQVAWLLRKIHISLEDTGNMEQIRLYKPFTQAILTSTSFKTPLGKNQYDYRGYHELAYLHPKRFTPNAEVLGKLGLKPGQSFVIMRFVSWEASHDIGHAGITLENKIRALEAFKPYARVIISSEKALPTELEPYRFTLAPEEMHSVMAFASLVYGESATMASEAAVLGVPAIYLDDTGRFYTRELEEKYGLVFNYTESLEDQDHSLQKALEIIKQAENREKWQEKRQRMLAEKIDVTAFLVWFVENYPESAGLMRENPQYEKFFIN